MAAATGRSPWPIRWCTRSCSCGPSPGSSRATTPSRCAARAFDSLVTAVQRAMAAGVIADGPATETAQLIWASIHGWVSLELLGIGFVEDQDAGYDRLCTRCLRGLRP